MDKTSPTKHTLYLVTGNVQNRNLIFLQENKLKEFHQILGDRFIIRSKNVDCKYISKLQFIKVPELQGDPIQIAKDKNMIAYNQINDACITEDTSLCFNALKGMPGPYIRKWFLDAVGPEGLSKMLDGFEDKTAYARCIISYMSPELKEPIQFIGITPVLSYFKNKKGQIVRPRGPNSFGWDPCFQPEGYEHTYAEMDKTIKNSISHRLKAINEMVSYFSDK